MDNCAVKSLVSGVLGAGMGLLFGGLFAPSADLSHIPVPRADGTYAPAAPFSWRRHFREVGRNAVWYSRSFGSVGLLFAGCECVIEKARGKSDLLNGLSGGCVTGAMLSYKGESKYKPALSLLLFAWLCFSLVFSFPGGPTAMVVGCGGFAAFSLVIDSLLGHG
jgi:import inner membrane translocase subunit TIM22